MMTAEKAMRLGAALQRIQNRLVQGYKYKSAEFIEEEAKKAK